MEEKNWWLTSMLVSLVLMVVLAGLWGRMNVHHVELEPLPDAQTVDAYLKQTWESKLNAYGYADQPTVKVKTGVFIQSLKFFNSSDVEIAGYVWQRYRDGIHDAIKPAVGEVGFILPEQVDASTADEPAEAYRIHADGETVIGWYFEATIRQPFDYKLYPFDHKTVWLRLWHKQFSENIVLVPDFDAYRSTAPGQVFGIDESIVLGTWHREDTYFDYAHASYSTNFGINDYVGQMGFPELRYNSVR